MKNISKRIATIFEKYYMDRAKERAVLIISFAHELMSNVNFPEDGYYVDENKIIKALDSYFLDVIKYKEYHFNCDDDGGDIDVFSEDWARHIHLNKKINDSKVAAFTSKWLLKASPIYVVPSSENKVLDDFTCHINAFFVLNCVLYCLLQYDHDLVDQDDYDKLFYDFRYRIVDDRPFFSRFELLEKNVRLKKEIKILKEGVDLA
jgi:hypothetical protein